jgi:hypothetical protein
MEVPYQIVEISTKLDIAVLGLFLKEDGQGEVHFRTWANYFMFSEFFSSALPGVGDSLA